MNKEEISATNKKPTIAFACKVKIAVVAVVVLLSFFVVLLSLSFTDKVFFNKAPTAAVDKPLTAPEFDIPNGVNSATIGLFSVTTEGGEAVYKRPNNINLALPIVIFINDSQFGDKEFNIVSSWEKAGYNVVVFEYMRAKLANASAYAQMFLHYYINFIASLKEYSGQEIRFVGGGCGAEVAIYAVAEMLKLEMENANFVTALPDRLALIDINNSDAPDIGANIKAISARGIATETVINVIDLAAQLPFGAFKEQLYKYSAVLEYRSDWVTIGGSAKNISLEWYSLSINHKLIADMSVADSNEYALSAKLPLSYVAARRGVLFAMQPNMTRELYDDTIISIGVNAPIVSGYAFYDNNANGANDERIASRAPTVKVEVYLKNGNSYKMLGSSMTTASGFYRIEIPAIYANRFDVLLVKCGLNKNLAVTERSNAFMMANDINASVLKSDMFTFNHRKNVIIKNIGVKNNK